MDNQNIGPGSNAGRRTNNLASIVLGASIAAVSSGCTITTDLEEKEYQDAPEDENEKPVQPIIYIDGRWSSDSNDKKYGNVFNGEPHTVSYESQTPPASVGEDFLKKIYAAAAEKFAQCLVEQGMQFYGAWWCDPCKTQKQIFGTGWPIIEKDNYTSCSDPGETDFLQACLDEKIYSLPQAHFDGVKSAGWMFLHEFEGYFNTLPCQYDGPKISKESDIKKYVDY